MGGHVIDDILVTITILLLVFLFRYMINDNSPDIIIITTYIKNSKVYGIIKHYYYSIKLLYDNYNGIKYISIYNYPIIDNVNSSYYDTIETNTNTNTNTTNNTTPPNTININDINRYNLYIKKQNECTESYLNNDDLEFFDNIINDIDYEDITPPYQAGNKYFYMKRNSLYDSSYCLYVSENLDKESTLMIQPPDGMVIRGIWSSNDGKMIAYGLTSIINNDTTTNSNVMSIKIRDVDTCLDLDTDTIICHDIDIFTLQWYQNHSGFFYVATSPSTSNVAIYYHVLGTSQKDDILTYDPFRNTNINEETKIDNDLLTLDITVTPDNHYLVIEVFKRDDAKFVQMVESSTKYGDITSCAGNSIRIIDLANFNNTLKPGLCAHLITSFNDRFQFISNIEEDFWFRTNYCASNYRVVRLNLPTVMSTVLTDENRYDPIIMSESYISSNIREWIPECHHGILQCASISALTVLVLKYFKDCSNEILIYDLSQSLDQIPDSPAATLPHPSFGTIYNPSCSFFSDSIFYKFSGFAHPCSIFRAQIHRNSGSGSIEISFDELYSVTIPGIDPYAFETQQDSFKSYDDTTIPMFIFGSKKLFQSGKSHPAAIYAYGSFGISVQPSFSLTILLYAHYCNAYFCVVNARGGSEKGSEWHRNFKKLNKIKTAEDIQCATDWLIENEYSQKARMTLIGEGAGIYLIAGIINKQPWKFQGAIFSQGLFDLRAKNTFADSLWSDEFGSIECNEENDFLEISSPINKLRNDDLLLTQPSMLLFVNKNHSAISPVDTYRFIETLRSRSQEIEKKIGDTMHERKPYLLYISDDSHLNDLYFLTFLSQQSK